MSNYFEILMSIENINLRIILFNKITTFAKICCITNLQISFI